LVAKKLNINTNIAATDFGDWTHILFWTSFWFIQKTEESAMMPNDKWVCSVLFLFGVISFDVCSCPLLLASQVEHLVDRFIKFWQLLPPPSRRRQLFWYSKLFSDEKIFHFCRKNRCTTNVDSKAAAEESLYRDNASFCWLKPQLF
jgi:hypothetical protein